MATLHQQKSNMGPPDIECENPGLNRAQSAEALTISAELFEKVRIILVAASSSTLYWTNLWKVIPNSEVEQR